LLAFTLILAVAALLIAFSGPASAEEELSHVEETFEAQDHGSFETYGFSLINGTLTIETGANEAQATNTEFESSDGSAMEQSSSIDGTEEKSPAGKPEKEEKAPGSNSNSNQAQINEPEPVSSGDGSNPPSEVQDDPEGPIEETEVRAPEGPSFKDGMELNRIVLNEDASVWMDMSDYFEDDATPSSQLVFQAFSEVAGISVEFSGTNMHLLPASNWNGECNLTIIVKDVDDMSLIVDVVVEIRPVNDPPRLEPFVDVEMRQGGSYTLHLHDYFTDLETHLEFDWASSEFMSFEYDPDTADLVITPDWAWYGETYIEIKADDSEFSVQDEFTLTVTPVWIPVRYTEIEINPVESTKRITLDSMMDTSVGIEEVRVVSHNTKVKVEVQEDNSILVIPEEGWTGETTLSINVKSSGGQVGAIQVPVVVSHEIRPLFGWLMNYLFATVFAGVVVTGRMYKDFRSTIFPSPVKLENYRHYRGHFGEGLGSNGRMGLDAGDWRDM